VVGTCLCMPLGGEDNPYALDGYLRVLFDGWKEADAFVYTVQQVVAYANTNNDNAQANKA
jgi:hypothetical protein